MSDESMCVLIEHSATSATPAQAILQGDWTLAGLWELILEALNESGTAPDTVQMIDSTIIRAHHMAAGAKGGLKKKLLAVQKVALRPRSTFSSTHTGFP